MNLEFRFACYFPLNILVITIKMIEMPQQSFTQPSFITQTTSSISATVM